MAELGGPPLERRRGKDRWHGRVTQCVALGQGPQLDLSGAADPVAVKYNFGENSNLLIASISEMTGICLKYLLNQSEQYGALFRDDKARSIEEKARISNGKSNNYDSSGRLHFVIPETGKLNGCGLFLLSNFILVAVSCRCFPCLYGETNVHIWALDLELKIEEKKNLRADWALNIGDITKEIKEKNFGHEIAIVLKQNLIIEKEFSLPIQAKTMGGAILLPLSAVVDVCAKEYCSSEEVPGLCTNEQKWMYCREDCLITYGWLKSSRKRRAQSRRILEKSRGSWRCICNFLRRFTNIEECLICFDELLELSQKGDNSNIDMLVGDIYGGMDYSKISYLNALQYGLKRIFFGGFFIRGHAYTMDTISFAISWIEKFIQKGTEITAPVPMAPPGTTGVGGFERPSSRGNTLRSDASATLKYWCSSSCALTGGFLLADPKKYEPNTVDLLDHSEFEYWFTVLSGAYA
ncbi:hypothetical protein HPP92_004507 [Vanilla planifolia]|uniref:Uncharacterized protein n=1 Tax=Vanilla planifolia TaxID=51239 RepID=A0A835RMX8_VANPL|nr:hypothetical protein HPP92_004507 [Vanilla planifolia]